MRTLILIKHSVPRIEPEMPASKWRLSEEGRLQSGWLADGLVPYAPEVIFCSVEPKAQETAELVSKQMSIPCHIVQGLHEQDRSRAAFLPQAEFERLVGEVFRQPERLVFGAETGRDASRRFDRAMKQALAGTDAQCVAIVTHGTVISLFAGEHAGCAPFDLWRQLECPSFVVLTGPPWQVRKVTARVASASRQPKS